MKPVKEVIVAGKTVFINCKWISENNVCGRKRRAKTNPTPEAVEKNNERNSVKKLALKLNHNFKGGDLHAVLTYEGEPPTPEQAKKDKANFFRRLERKFEKLGKELFRVDVTEYENKRIHHHVVLSQISADIVRECWNHGYVKFSVLDNSGNYKKLAEYLTKETRNTFRRDNNPNKRRFNCSRNVITPECRRYNVSAAEINKELKPLKGYYIDPDSVVEYTNIFTNRECRECIMVSLTDEPRLKRWNKGKKVNLERNIPMPVEEQLGILL